MCLCTFLFPRIVPPQTPYRLSLSHHFLCTVGLHNVSGHAEHVEVSGEIGSERSTQFTVSFEQPKPLDLPVTLSARITQLLLNHQKTSSYAEMTRGGAIGIKRRAEGGCWGVRS